MALPNMRSGVVSREFLRIAGGYESPALGTSPAGGLDVDNAGNLATDGDITTKGGVDVQGGDIVNSTGDLVLDAQNAAADSTIYLKNSDGTYVADVDVEGNLLVRGGDVVNPAGNAVLRAETGDSAVWLQASGSGSIYLNRYGGSGGTRFGNAAGDTVAIMSGAGKLSMDGDLEVDGGDIDAGTDGGVRGVISAWDGSGGSAPGCLRLCSPNGMQWYLFIEDDGTLKVHSALPTQNADGLEVGSQT